MILPYLTHYAPQAMVSDAMSAGLMSYRTAVILSTLAGCHPQNVTTSSLNRPSHVSRQHSMVSTILSTIKGHRTKIYIFSCWAVYYSEGVCPLHHRCVPREHAERDGGQLLEGDQHCVQEKPYSTLIISGYERDVAM